MARRRLKLSIYPSSLEELQIIATGSIMGLSTFIIWLVKAASDPQFIDLPCAWKFVIINVQTSKKWQE
jgi:hypothetical protein